MTLDLFGLVYRFADQGLIKLLHEQTVSILFDSYSPHRAYKWERTNLSLSLDKVEPVCLRARNCSFDLLLTPAEFQENFSVLNSSILTDGVDMYQFSKECPETLMPAALKGTPTYWKILLKNGLTSYYYSPQGRQEHGMIYSVDFNYLNRLAIDLQLEMPPTLLCQL